MERMGMADWCTFLGPDTIDWLLEPDNPSVRYLTRTRLLDMPETDPDTVSARRAIMTVGTVPAILSTQHDGTWNEKGAFYRDKYRGTVWQLIILAELAADGTHPQIRAACEYLLSIAQDRESHGFAYDGNEGTGGTAGTGRAKPAGGRHSQVIPCLTGNMVWSLIALGYADDPRVQRAADWIVRYQRFDDSSDGPPAEWPYDRYEICWGRHTCHMGAIKALKALSAIPEERRTPEMRKTIRDGCEYFLVHHIHKRSHDLGKVAKPGWLRLQFPLMYQTDILEVSAVLLELGYRDDRMQEAIEKIGSKRDASGRWRLEQTFNGRFQVDIETKGKASKWITLRALDVLKGFYG